MATPIVHVDGWHWSTTFFFAKLPPPVTRSCHFQKAGSRIGVPRDSTSNIKLVIYGKSLGVIFRIQTIAFRKTSKIIKLSLLFGGGYYKAQPSVTGLPL